MTQKPRVKSSSGDGHNYLKGHRFWVTNQFWETGMYTEKAKEYYRERLAAMLQNERRSYLITP